MKKLMNNLKEAQFHNGSRRRRAFGSAALQIDQFKEVASGDLDGLMPKMSPLGVSA
jgi:hypothetical protein